MKLTDLNIKPARPELEYEKIDRFLEVPLKLKSFRFASGKFGEYAVMVVEDEKGELHAIANGGVYVLQTLKQIEKVVGSFFEEPVEVEFCKEGKAYVIK